MIRLYPEVNYDDPEHGPRAGLVHELIWAVAEQVPTCPAHQPGACA